MQRINQYSEIHADRLRWQGLCRQAASARKSTKNCSAFKKREPDKIADIILSSPFYLSKLESGILPPQLLSILNEQGIKLFPSSWEDMKAHCSCPDWAVPCKHIAAVIYLIANEIAKNPFIIFNLHCYNIIGAIKPNLKKHISSISNIENMLKKQANQAHPISNDTFPQSYTPEFYHRYYLAK